MAAFEFLDAVSIRYDEGVLPHAILRQGFEYEGSRVPLIGPQGIFKPRVLPEMPLSIQTAPPKEGKKAPYADVVGPDGLLHYAYRGTDPDHRDNRGLRLAMQRQAPLVYLFGIVPGRYLPIYPVHIVGDDPPGLTFRVAVDPQRIALFTRPAPVTTGLAAESDSEDFTDTEAVAGRRYRLYPTPKRLHQLMFRERVLRAYRECCAICRLRHRELLDAAHILPDSHPKGEPVVHNGIALCRLHHAAYDRHLLGIRPDLTVMIDRRVLEEEDGPMLVHGLQGFQGIRLTVPRAQSLRPNPDFLAERYEIFRRAG